MAAQLMLLNPRKKHRSAAQRAATKRLIAFNRRGGSRKRRRNPTRAVARRSAPARRRSFRRKRGGGIAGLGGIMNALMPAAVGGAGALGVDVLFGYLPIPAQFKTGVFAPIAKIGGALAIGWLASNFTTKRTADQIMVGAITVTVYNLAKGWLQTAMPQIALGEYVTGYGDPAALGYVNAAQFQADPLIAAHIPDYENRASAGLSEYVTGDMEYANGNGW